MVKVSFCCIKVIIGLTRWRVEDHRPFSPCRDFSPALFNSVPILPSGSSMSSQLTPQLSSDSSPGQASSMGLKPTHDPMLTSPPPNNTAKPMEDNNDGYGDHRWGIFAVVFRFTLSVLSFSYFKFPNLPLPLPSHLHGGWFSHSRLHLSFSLSSS